MNGSAMPASANDVSSSSATPRRSSGRGDHGTVKTDFLCRVKYSNTLPDIPFEAKFLSCPFVSLNRFVDYKPSGLEKNFKWELLTEPDLGVHIDLINPDTYYIDPDANKQMDPVDALLLEDEQANPQNSRRSQQHSKMVPWMRKTEYISSEFQRFGVSADRQETKIGYGVLKFQNETYRDRASQIAAINKTFEEAAKPRQRHPTKKGVEAIEEAFLLPDFDNWIHPFALVVFDGDPVPLSEKADPQTLMSQALIRGMMDEEGEQFVTYFLPIKETLEMRMNDIELGREFNPDYIYEYYSVRDYNWLVRNKATKGYVQDIYLFTWRENGLFYNELETRVTLSRRKSKKERQQTKLLVHNRPYEEDEIIAQRDRLNRLLHPHDERDEDEGSDKDSSDAEEGGGDSDGGGGGGEKKKSRKIESDDDDDSDHEAPPEPEAKKSSSESSDDEKKNAEEASAEEGSDAEMKSERSRASSNDSD